MTERSKIADEIEAFVADDESYLVTLALARFIKANLPTILAALRADSPAAVERAFREGYAAALRDTGLSEDAADGPYRDDLEKQWLGSDARAALEPPP